MQNEKKGLPVKHFNSNKIVRNIVQHFIVHSMPVTLTCVDIYTFHENVSNNNAVFLSTILGQLHDCFNPFFLSECQAWGFFLGAKNSPTIHNFQDLYVPPFTFVIIYRRVALIGF